MSVQIDLAPSPLWGKAGWGLFGRCVSERGEGRLGGGTCPELVPAALHCATFRFYICHRVGRQRQAPVHSFAIRW